MMALDKSCKPAQLLRLKRLSWSFVIEYGVAKGSVLVRGRLFFMVFVGKEVVVMLMRLFLHMLVMVGDRPLLPVFMGRVLHLVVLQLMLLLRFLMLLVWELRLPGLARVRVLVFVLVLVGTNMRLVIGLLVVLIKLLVLARARLLLHGPVDTKLVMLLVVVLV
jgi:hypothetical protein